MFCGETIIPKGTRGSQLSFKFTIRSFLPGCVYAITGPSGSGKTTLLSLLAGVDLPQKGSVEFDGISTAQRNLDEYRLYHAAVIYQKFNLFSHLTAVENMAYPLLLRKLRGRSKSAFRKGFRGDSNKELQLRVLY